MGKPHYHWCDGGCPDGQVSGEASIDDQLLVSFTRWRYSSGSLSVKGIDHDLALILARNHGGKVYTSTTEVYDDGTEILRPWRLICEFPNPKDITEGEPHGTDR